MHLIDKHENNTAKDVIILQKTEKACFNFNPLKTPI